MDENRHIPKHDVLRSVAHNMASSMASGIGLFIGAFDFNVFEEAKQSPEGYIQVDFLAGKTSGGRVSDKLANVVRSYHDALPEFCKKHGVSLSDFAVLTARYSSAPTANFTVSIKDRVDRQTTTEYSGFDGHRTKVLDAEGRIRPIPVQRS